MTGSVASGERPAFVMDDEVVGRSGRGFVALSDRILYNLDLRLLDVRKGGVCIDPSTHMTVSSSRAFDTLRFLMLLRKPHPRA
jgi:hypothetical protein